MFGTFGMFGTFPLKTKKSSPFDSKDAPALHSPFVALTFQHETQNVHLIRKSKQMKSTFVICSTFPPRSGCQTNNLPNTISSKWGEIVLIAGIRFSFSKCRFHSLAQQPEVKPKPPDEKR